MSLDAGPEGGRCAGRAGPGYRVSSEPDEAFRGAIDAGVLSPDRSASNWAGHYFYMFHDEDGTSWFKHRDTRAYVKSGQG